MPFVSGGGGYLRQIDEENSDLVTGTEIHGGGGVKYWFGSGGRRLGLRFDAGVSSAQQERRFRAEAPARAGGRRGRDVSVLAVS